ncbi:hypothetical protein ACW0US_17725 [Xanthomonas euvesicatoria]
MNSIAFKEGPFHYSAPSDLIDKVFESGDGGKRSFKIVVASAYNAGGLIGSEHNGVAVLDVDAGCVVVDRLGQPYDVAGHRALAADLANADWSKFLQIITGSRNYRGVLESEVGGPEYRHPLPESENWPVIEVEGEGQADDGAFIYTYPARKRLDVIEELCHHTVHSDGFRGAYALAWDIKVHSFDQSGKSEDYPGEARFDSLWAKEVERDPQIFADACSAGLDMYLSNEYTVFPGVEQGDYHFQTQGRSGGWLALTKVDGLPSLVWGSRAEMRDALMELDRDELSKLYKAVRNLDHDLRPEAIKQEMAYQFASQRSHLEEDWKELSDDELEEKLEGRSSLRM